MRIGPVIFLAALAAGIALPLAVRHGARVELDAKNETARRQADELAGLAVENSRLSNAAAPAGSPSALSPDELAELLKLRSEISGLRQQTNAAAQLREENRLLRERVATEQNFQPVTVPRASFADAGRASPEAAFQSFIWAMSKGYKNEVLRNLTGDAADGLGKHLMTMSDAEFSASVAWLSEHLAGYQILSKQVVSDDAVILLISLQGGPERQDEAVTVKKDNGEWKLSSQNAFH